MDKKYLRKAEPFFKKYHIKTVYLFGSMVSKKMHNGSDVDMGMRFYKKLTLKHLLKLAMELENVLGRPVDIVDLDEAPLALQYRVYRDKSLLYAENLCEELMNQTKALTMYYDYKYYLDRFIDAQTERIVTKGLL